MLIEAQGPPQTPQSPPDAVWGEVWSWLQILLWVVDAVAIAAVIILGAVMVLDKNRGEAVSATAPQVAAVKIALGVAIASSAVTIATWFA